MSCFAALIDTFQPITNECCFCSVQFDDTSPTSNHKFSLSDDGGSGPVVSSDSESVHVCLKALM